jgi:hypothetical protein
LQEGNIVSHETTCPSCRRVLRVSENVHTRWLTCPRCLAAMGERTAPPTPPPEPPEDHSAHASNIRRRPAPPPLPDVDVRRDLRGVNVAALVLGGLLLMGVVLFFGLGGFSAVVASDDANAVLLCGVLILGAVVAGLVALAYGARNRIATVLSSVVGGLVVGAGGILLVIVLFCMSIAAAFNNVCKFNLKAPTPPASSAPSTP